MRSSVQGILGVVVAAMLTGCAGQSEQLSMQQPGTPGPAGTVAKAPPPQQITFPNGTIFGGASSREASSLAQIVVDSNNNNMKEYHQIQATQSKDYQQLVNVPHQFFKVYGLGDVYSPKEASLTMDQRYQNVRIVAVYQTDQVPVLPAAPKS